MTSNQEFVVELSSVTNADVGRVGGKNASLGEMIQQLEEAGVRVPGGFATTSEAYWWFLDEAGIRARLDEILSQLSDKPLEKVGSAIRKLIGEADLPQDLDQAIRKAYRQMAEQSSDAEPPVAVRSSATAEDLPEASFAGQQETFLNIRGEESLIKACKRCYASLFTNRAITYRENHEIDHTQVALSVGVQHMVRSDTGGAGVMFSIDTETGFPDAVLISANWGLGETVVQGSVDPDEYRVFKPLLENEHLIPVIEKRVGGKEQKLIYSDDPDKPTELCDTSEKERILPVLSDTEICQLARWAKAIETHYDRPMDMEWARDGETGEIFIVQARPETVESRKEAQELKTFSIGKKGELLVSGLSIGSAIAVGKACVLESASDIDRFEEGAVLVTTMTDPDWVPIMKKAVGLVTDHGGRTSHAAIVSRELGLPAIVGTDRGSEILKNGQEITVSCAEGDKGFVYEGAAEYESRDVSLKDIPDTRTKVMLNLANPDAALRWWRLPSDGVGLARMEFVINNIIKIHPMALIQPDKVNEADRDKIAALTAGWDDKKQYFVDHLASGVARIAASQYPEPVIVRMSDFKTNEYADLIGGEAFEPKEANPMLGWRGASRYYSEEYRDGFALECQAIRKAREVMGLDNVIIMIPFCRTPEEAEQVIRELGKNGLVRGDKGLEVYVMAEIPANVILADEFSEHFDGFSIGSNDLTQLVLGIDRDSQRLAPMFDDRHRALRRAISELIATAHKHDRKVGLCGQAPSDHPEFARFLVDAGIDSMSVGPDSFVNVKQEVAKAERRD
ncbi:MAG: phosphoenolpyruvate synthase [Oleiphilaceae bacterium]|nr:phosphoenolpyruvate synthase [Oleiphilaceae bacterium]